jgi:hypothetical protein
MLKEENHFSQIIIIIAIIMEDNRKAKWKRKDIENKMEVLNSNHNKNRYNNNSN